MSASSYIELYEEAIPSFLADQLNFRSTKIQPLAPFFAAELAVIYKLLDNKFKFKYRKEATIDTAEKNVTAFNCMQISAHYKLHWFSKCFTSLEAYEANSRTFQAIYEVVKDPIGAPAIRQEYPLNRATYSVLSKANMRQFGDYGIIPLNLEIASLAKDLAYLIGYEYCDFGGINTPEHPWLFNLFTFRKDRRGGFFYRKKYIHEHALLFELL